MILLWSLLMLVANDLEVGRGDLIVSQSFNCDLQSVVESVGGAESAEKQFQTITFSDNAEIENQVWMALENADTAKCGAK